MLLLRRVTGYVPAVVTCGALLSALIALSGYGMLGFLFCSRYYAPASSHYVRPLHFDYTGYVAVAYAPLSPDVSKPTAQKKGQAPPRATDVLPTSRFLPSGTQVGVYVRLLMPSDHADLFQVTGELLSNGSHVAARSVRTHINTPRPPVYRFARHMLMLPFHMIGLGHGDWVKVDLPLFDSYEEREDEPVSLFRARLASRNSSRGALPPPPVYKAEVHVRLRLGLLQTVLLWLRPGRAAGWALLLLGSGASLGGSLGTVGLLILAFVLRRWVVSRSAMGKRSGGRRRSGAALTGPPHRKQHDMAPPYGDADGAMIYSLEHAQIYRSASSGSDRGQMATVEDYGGDDDQSLGQRPNGGRMSRQASALSQQRAAPAVESAADKSPAWTGSSSGDSAYAPTPVGKAGDAGVEDEEEYSPPPRKASGEPSWPAEPASIAVAAAGPSGDWAPPLQVAEPGAAPGIDGGSQDGGGPDEQGSPEGESREQSESGEEDEEEDEHGAMEDVDRGLATPGKAPVPSDARRGDVEPEADSGAVRKRTGFTWQA